jgi:DNA-binding PadR family transcriptional regulator
MCSTHRYYVRRSKLVVVADRRLLVLVSLNDGPRHGYAIQQDIESFAGIRLGPGTLYGAIASLERDGLIRAIPGEDRRRPYEIAPAGRHALRDELSAMSVVLRRAGAAFT